MKRSCWFIVMGCLTGCVSHQTPAPVEAFSPTYSVSRGTHLVKGGESINSIAWRYGRDVEELKAINKLDDGSRLRPGQVIALSKDSVKASKKNKPVATFNRPFDRKPASQREHPIGMVKKEQQVANYTPPPSSSSSAQTSSYVEEPTERVVHQEVIPYQEELQADVAQTPPPAQEPKAYETSGVALQAGQWVWPVRNKQVLEGFKSDSHSKKGIVLGGGLGDPVLASASGTVVYKGNGIRGYGLMVIIKHDNNFLSAYGHNNAILVNEGDRVIAGQKIAEMGQTDAESVQLHFEIRKNGKPVDPVAYLKS